MTVATSAGAKIGIGTTAATASTDAYTNIGSVTNIPEFGRVYKEIQFSPLGTRGVTKFKGSYDDGSMQLELGRDVEDAGQAAAIIARDVDADYNFRVTLNDAQPVETATVTITIAAPGVVSWANHGLPANSEVMFSTTGALPTGLTAATPYYVVAGASLTTNSFEVSATAGGSAITTTGSQSGVHTGVSVPAPTTIYLKAKVMSYTLAITTTDTVTSAKMLISITAGTTVETPHLP